MKEIINFFEFLKRPQYKFEEKKDMNVFKTAFKIFLITFSVLTIFNGFVNFILGLFFTLPKDKLEDFFESMKIGRWAVFLLMVLIAPLLEELIFRLPLIFKTQYISIVFSVLIAALIHCLIPYLPGIILFFPLFLIISYYVPKHEKFIYAIWVNYFRFVVWFSAIIFGLAHIGNFELVKTVQYFIVPFLVIPQLCMGFVLSYVRLTYKNGFMIGLLVHIFINLTTTTIYLLQN